MLYGRTFLNIYFKYFYSFLKTMLTFMRFPMPACSSLLAGWPRSLAVTQNRAPSQTLMVSDRPWKHLAILLAITSSLIPPLLYTYWAVGNQDTRFQLPPLKENCFPWASFISLIKQEVIMSTLLTLRRWKNRNRYESILHIEKNYLNILILISNTWKEEKTLIQGLRKHRRHLFLFINFC